MQILVSRLPGLGLAPRDYAGPGDKARSRYDLHQP